ncbi:MAG TPA: polysaccharide biosynthesis/export family protein [Anaeromyxobacteraceae bacterium]|jgi:polysaccharide export outer membrane protein|nr:polysaccharide biosynthesis/export family protein [Anaeromyxobacteraceae bacterium]
MSHARQLQIATLFGLLAGCSHVGGGYVWVDSYQDPAAARSENYVISAGDLINVRVFNQDGLSGRTRVREDGKISMPFLNDVEVAGLEPATVANQLGRKLRSFIVNPVVTVSLEERVPFEVSVLGEVTKPGVYRLQDGAGLLKALATAGGLTFVAQRDGIFVLRYGDAARRGVPTRIRFTYKALTQVTGGAASFALRSGDVVVVE